MRNRYTVQKRLYELSGGEKFKLGKRYFQAVGQKNQTIECKALYTKAETRFYSTETKVLVKGGSNV